MALVLADRVQETTTTTGTGTLTLSGAASGYQSFAAIGDGNTTYYTIVSGTDWEVGIGAYTASGTTLSRDTVLASSASGAKISVASGASVFSTYPASKAVGTQTGYFDSDFKGAFVDGVAVDYISGAGRISVGGSDDIRFYNGGVAGSELGRAKSNGDWVFNGFIDVGNGTLVSGATNPLIAASASANSYVQGYIHNDQNGTSSSADLTCYPHNGLDTSGWVDLGITSLSYSDANYSITQGNEGYVFMSAPSGSSTSGNLVYATDSTGSSNAHQWYVGGFNQSKTAYKMQLNATNLYVKQAVKADGVIESTTGGFKFPDASTQTTAATPFTGGTLTSQLKLAAGTATAATAPIEFTSGTLNATAEAGAMEYDGTAFYASQANSTRGVLPTEQWVVLNGTYTLTSQTAAQKLFNATTNGAVTLPVGTYQFECMFSLTSMSATSGTFGFALGGTATKTQTWISNALKAATLTTAATNQITYNTTNANTAIVSASTQTSGIAYIRGVIRVTVAGTVIPQVSLSVAAAAVVATGSYFKISPVGSSTVTAVGNWS